ncbi:MAG TPA: T9SS type A sorting domain-containing protein [Caldithrix abyssi]|uniref:T9SS type A sorting domain-containing protein n=1 Tax=Caldithrix abyssi TaxID=187145 RepID=A0A7V5PQE9_CALAY|nr:T9SS type A sorting domain-containing protein [Caldithrix abyssi]
MIRVFLLVLLIVSFLPAQEWVLKMENRSENFYEIQKEFYRYWNGRKITRGDGWKQFKRWEWFWEPRVYPDGNFPPPDQIQRALAQSPLRKSQAVNNAADWTSLGPDSWVTVSYNPGIGRVNCVYVDSLNPNTLMIGAPSGGYWKSADGAATWRTTTDHLEALGVSSIAVHPRDANTIFIATGDGDGGNTYSIGVLKSTDGGETWQSTGLSWATTESHKISKLLINEQDPLIMLAAANNGIFRTEDGGDTWTNVISGDFKDMEFKPGDPNTVYACGRQFYRSADGGQTFSKVTSGLPRDFQVGRMAIAVTPGNDAYVYVLACDIIDNKFLGLYRSTNSGSSFGLQSDSPNILGYDVDGNDDSGQGWYDLAVAASPTNPEEVFVGGVNIWRSTDGGVTWSLNGYWYYPNQDYPYVHADIHALDFYGNTLYAGSDGGLWKTDDAGQNWEDLSFGLVITQFYRLGGYPADRGLVIAGTQDNGTNLLDSGTWTHVYGSDGMEAAINKNNPDTMYASYYNGGLMRSEDGGQSFHGITGDITESGAWVTPYVLSPQNPQVLFAGFENVWKSTNGGDNWTKISNFNVGTLSALALAESDSDYIYAASGSHIFRTTDGGNSWIEISGGLPVDSVSLTYIAVSDNDPDLLWVTFSGYKDGIKVYRSADGGSNWENISGSLPNLPVNCIAVEPMNANHPLYVGTDAGVYYRDDATGDWEAYNTNLPNVIVNELEIHSGSKTIKAASYGRGMWESPLQSTVSGLARGNNGPPAKFVLYPNSPNPFNPSTVIRYRIESAGRVQLDVFNTLGERVRVLANGVRQAGDYRVNFEADGLPSGVYYYRLTVNGASRVQKMILLR